MWKQLSNFNKYNASICEKIINIKFHRIIAQTFMTNPNNKPTINHKDKNKQNNHISNLEWTSHNDQSIHINNIIPSPPITKTTKKSLCLMIILKKLHLIL
jgi:hypothetical protein